LKFTSWVLGYRIIWKFQIVQALFEQMRFEHGELTRVMLHIRFVARAVVMAIVI